MHIQSMKIPRTRGEFEYRINLLGEAVKKGRYVNCVQDEESLEGFGKVRFSGNNRIDLLTIDESVRLSANMMAQMKDIIP